jgi:hypothetical protein
MANELAAAQTNIRAAIHMIKREVELMEWSLKESGHIDPSSPQTLMLHVMALEYNTGKREAAKALAGPDCDR